MEIDFDRVKPGDKGYEGDTEGAWIVAGVTPNGVDLRHESGEHEATRINWISAAEPNWRWFRDASGRATTTGVAQALSRAIDEHQESGSPLESYGLRREGLFLDDAPGAEETDLRITEVSAELENAANGLMSQFTVKTSDGQEWTVRITPKA